jgi:predicted RND superfamily exporter protein
MPTKKKTITIVSVASAVAIIATITALYGRAVTCFDLKVIKMVDDRVEHDPRFDCIENIRDDIEEIKLMIAIMNQGNPEYEKAIKILRNKKE